MSWVYVENLQVYSSITEKEFKITQNQIFRHFLHSCSNNSIILENYDGYLNLKTKLSVMMQSVLLFE